MIVWKATVNLIIISNLIEALLWSYLLYISICKFLNPNVIISNIPNVFNFVRFTISAVFIYLFASFPFILKQIFPTAINAMTTIYGDISRFILMAVDLFVFYSFLAVFGIWLSAITLKKPKALLGTIKAIPNQFYYSLVRLIFLALPIAMMGYFLVLKAKTIIATSDMLTQFINLIAFGIVGLPIHAFAVIVVAVIFSKGYLQYWQSEPQNT